MDKGKRVNGDQDLRKGRDPEDRKRLRLFSAALEEAAEGIQLVDLDGRIIYSNRAVEKIYGFTPEEFLGRHVDELNVDPEFAGKRILPAIREKGHWSGELEVKHKDGHHFPISLSTSLVMGDEGRPFAMVGVIRDITGEKLYREKLEQGEAQYRAMFESQADAVMIFDEECRIVDANPAASRIYGYSREDLIGMDCKALIAPDHSHFFEEARQVVRRGQIYHAESMDRRKGGGTFPTDVRISPFEYKGFPHALVVARDMSLIRETRTALERSEESLAAIFDNVRAGILVIDPEKHTVVNINRKGAEMVGLPRGDIIGGICHKFVCPAEEGKCPITDLKERVDNSERVLVCADGSRMPILKTVVSVDLLGKPMLIESFVDISDLKQSEALFRTIFQTSPDAVSINRMEDGVYVSVNDGFTALTGYAMEDLVGETPMTIGIWTDRADLERLAATLREKKSVSNFESRFRLKDGRVRSGLLSAHLVDMDGRPHVVSVTRDIDDLKQVENYLKQALADLEDKNRELEAFVYTAAHDLRTPIISVLGFVELLKKDLAETLEKEQSYMLGRIGSNVRHFDNLLKDLLEYSQSGVSKGDRVKVSVNDLLVRILEEEGIEGMRPVPRVIVEEGMPLVYIQETRAYQLFRNLVSNSLKFAREDVPLVVEIGVRAEKREDVPPGHVLFRVSDNGIGIEKKYHDTVFGLFTRPGKSRASGTGVGLAIVKRIVESEKGVLWLDSAPGKGSTFYFSLPVGEDQENLKSKI